MLLLSALWVASIAVLVASVAVMLLVLLKRVLADILEARQRRRRRAVEALLFRYLEGTATMEETRAAARGRRGAAAFLAAVRELLELLRGGEADRLRTLLDEPRPRAALLRAARRGTRASRLDAVETLAVVPSDEATAALRLLAFADRDPILRAVAARALHARGPELVDAPVLAAVLAHDAAAPLAAPLLRRLAVERPDALLQLLDGWPDPPVLVALLDALGHAADYGLAVRLAGFLEHANARVRAAAATTLARFSDPRTAAAVLHALGDPSWEVRAAAAAAVAAGAVRSAEAVPALRPLLDDEVWPVRHAAATALLGAGEDGRRTLAILAEAGDRAGRVSQMVLGELGGAEFAAAAAE